MDHPAYISLIECPKVIDAIDHEINLCVKRFRKYEKKKYDHYNGTNQASTKEGLIEHHCIERLMRVAWNLQLEVGPEPD